MNLVARGVAEILLRRLTGKRRLGGKLAFDPARFRIGVKDPVCLQRISDVLAAFFSGFEAGLKGSAPGVQDVDPLFRPFFEEGVAMGFLPNGYLRLVSARKSLLRFEEALCGENDPHLFMRYVGIGFWLGFRHPRRAERIDRLAALLGGRRYRYLVHDGYGFKLGFFDLPRPGAEEPFGLGWQYAELKKDEEESLERKNLGFAARLQEMQRELRASLPTSVLERLEGFARYSAFHGLGRSLWFFYMDRAEAAISMARFLAPSADAIVGGLGLAAAFTFVDQLSRAYTIADTLEEGDRLHFLKGIRVALYVRAASDAKFVQTCIERQEPEVRQRATQDLEHALKVGNATRQREDFIEAFHQGCLRAP